MKITKSSYVEVHYKMSFEGFDGEVVEETQLDEPVQFMMGQGEMLPKFEENIIGLGVGDKFKFMLDVDNAFGPYDEESLMEISKKDLEQDEANKNRKYQEGDIVNLYDEDGEMVPVEIIEVRPESIVVDLNHPLVGEDLYFQGVIIAVEK